MQSKHKTEVDIRPWSDADLALLERLRGDPAMNIYLGGPESPGKIRERHERYRQSIHSGQDHVFVIVVGPGRVAAGSVVYWEKEWRSQHVWEMGWIDYLFIRGLVPAVLPSRSRGASAAAYPRSRSATAPRPGN
jgi:RimJ/RimL family protein N-acetyltransferase